MEKEDIYIHYKGGKYEILAVTKSLKDKLNLELDSTDKIVGERITNVRYHENTHNIELYIIDNEYYVDSNISYIIYKSMDEESLGLTWAREYYDFFGSVLNDENEKVERFKIINKL